MPVSPDGTRSIFRNWLSDLGFDAAKLGLLLYVLGLLASSLYYSRFSILTLDLAKAQCILVGIYIVILYAAIPATTLFTMKNVARSGVIVLVFFGVLGIFDSIAAWAMGYRDAILVRVALLTAILQFLLFCDFAGFLRALVKRRMQVVFLLPPPRTRALLFAMLFCVHFSLSWFPQIPTYLGGGRPLSVQVFTKTADLPANRFVDSKNHPKINKSLDSFTLRLLYETDKDVYFVSDLEAGGSFAGYSVMRLAKSEIVRIDYITPKWVEWRGAP